ncbi:MAG: DUF47 family protein [candidate division Zixibacteria bacterium]|nr:DUF47 family protein [candidate division Zixibacteria bacterium]
MAILFKNIKALEKQIDEFLDAVSQGAVVFKLGIKDYLDCNMDRFNERIDAIGKLESKADNLRRQVENHLYTHSLIPEYRGDVLGLLENMDDIIDTAKETLNRFLIESPEILPELKDEFLELTDVSIKSAESVVLSVRAFFTDISAVKNYIHKVYFYEKESDKVSNRLKMHIFNQDIDLSRKMHLRDFADHVDSLSDCAQAVADRLTIYSIKRLV